MRSEINKWREINRSLKPNEIEFLFKIPFSYFLSAVEIRRGEGSSFYKFIGDLEKIELLEKETKTSNDNGKKIRTYRRTFRYYRIRANVNGGIIVEVSN